MTTDDRGRRVITTSDQQVVEAVFPDENPQRVAALRTAARRRSTRQRKIATSVYFTQRQLDWLNQTADRDGVSVASLIRQAIDEFAIRTDRRRRKG
jgi:predicted DNA-binding ribbon-helix-helix protein